jgi:hypothetical protein
MGRHPEADLAQTGVEHGHHLLARACIGGAAAEDRDHVFCLLRTRTQRPHRRHSAEKSNEFAPLHSNAPAAAFPRGKHSSKSRRITTMRNIAGFAAAVGSWVSTTIRTTD